MTEGFGYETEVIEQEDEFADSGLPHCEIAVNEDSVKAYLKEIGRYKLLTSSEEIQLSRAVKTGDRVGSKH